MDIWKQFEENGLTHSAAHHLIAIMELKSKNGYARVTDVARHLNITTGSASTNLKALKIRGLITEDGNRFLALSNLGEQLVEAVISHKKILFQFLTIVLGVSENQADIDSCKIEHLISPETAAKMSEYLRAKCDH
jgi:DtxR family Mn-dependent transcriptional regulator